MAAPVDPYDFQNLVSIMDAAQVNLRFKRLFDALDKTKIGLDGNSFKDGAFTAAKFLPFPGWSTVGLVNASGLTWTAPALLSYYKDASGLVRLRNEKLAFTGTLALGTWTVGTMPVGTRPGVKTYCNITNYSAGGPNTPIYLTIDTDGTMQILATAPAPTAPSFVPYGIYRAES